MEAALRDGFLEISVSDTGIGIPKEQHEAVFDKFYQVGATTKGVREGTGSAGDHQGLVEEHGGRIWSRASRAREAASHSRSRWRQIHEEGPGSGR